MSHEPLRFSRRVHLPSDANEAFAWHARDGAFERLTPPWEKVEVIHRTGPLAEGMRATLAVRVGPFAPRWVAEHIDVKPGQGFVDRQENGPFGLWEHHHRLDHDPAGGCWLEDDIRYETPLYPFGRIGKPFVEHKLDRMFGYRHDVTVHDLAAHKRMQELLGGRKLTIAISGASGLVGSALAPFLSTGGHTVKRLVRREPAAEDEVRFDVRRGLVDAAALEGVDAVVHLAGENVGEGRWTEDKRRRILESRTESTRLLAETLARLQKPPSVLVSASAIGFYGDRGDAILDEEASAGTGFLADVCRAWERETEAAEAAGIRVVHARIG
ncbi:MAG: NAD-dependent epimerase/dehydratase family protein, partial [Myxococcota bacterium]